MGLLNEYDVFVTVRVKVSASNAITAGELGTQAIKDEELSDARDVVRVEAVQTTNYS